MPPERSALGVVRDNVEAIGFALILALLLRHFAIEVFKIPTASMEPTLFGDNSQVHPDTAGDRIIVDKMAYLFGGPSRWDVVVFHYPLNWGRNFIKRAVGLPDEGFRIERGDPWVGPWTEGRPPELHPARKPRHVRDQLYVPLCPPTGARAKDRPADWWRERPNGPGAFHVESFDRFVYDGDTDPAATGGPPATLEYGFPIRDTDRADLDPRLPDSSSQLVPDVRLSGEVLAHGSAEVEVAWEPGDGRRHLLRLASEGRQPSEARATKTSKPLAARLVADKAVRFELESVDGDLRAWVDGDEVAVLPDEISLEEAGHLEELGSGAKPQVLTVSARGGRVEIRHVALWHDLYYTNHRLESANQPRSGDTFHIPSESYFMLGDNTRHSSDSRRWNASGVKLKDGTRILWDPQGDAPPKYLTVDGRSAKEVADIEGVTRRWFLDEEDTIDAERMPVVRRDRIIGRAWFALVFWPLKDLWQRVRFIH